MVHSPWIKSHHPLHLLALCLWTQETVYSLCPRLTQKAISQNSKRWHQISTAPHTPCFDSIAANHIDVTGYLGSTAVWGCKLLLTSEINIKTVSFKNFRRVKISSSFSNQVNINSEKWRSRTPRFEGFLVKVDLFFYLKQVIFLQKHLNDSGSGGQI